MAKLSSLSEGSVGLADRVKQSEIRSPVNGTVKQLFTNTVGGVVQPGKDVIAVVPSEDTLLLREPKSCRATSRSCAPDSRRWSSSRPTISRSTAGSTRRLEHIGADSMTDDKGNSYFLVRVRTQNAYLEENGKQLPIIPGMVAEVDILTGKKTVLSYLLKPVLRAKAAALRER